MKKRKLTDEDMEWKAERVTLRKRYLELKALRDAIKKRVAETKKAKRAKSGATMGLIAVNTVRRGKSVA